MVFARHDPLTATLLVGAGIITALPLMAFAAATQRLDLATVGMLMYINPTMQFVTAVWLFGEPLQPARLVSFGLIWSASSFSAGACGKSTGIADNTQSSSTAERPMGLLENTLIILLLIATSAFFSISEISLAAARKLKLEQRATTATRAPQGCWPSSRPGHFFTAVQIGLNAVAILAGVLGEGAYAPSSPALSCLVGSAGNRCHARFGPLLPAGHRAFVLLADLLPKRIAIVAPEAIALRIAGPMALCICLLTPLVWAFNGPPTG